MGRAPCCEKVGLKRGKWTAEEDEKLVKYIKDNGEGSWRSLPKNAGLLRCGKSCRLRWINYLREDLKRGNISREEEEIIVKLHASLGQRWSLIASHLPGRTDNEIKNYWNSHLSRRIYTFRRSNGGHSPIIFDIGDATRGPRRKGGRTSRSAMKESKKTKATTTTTTTDTGVPINEEKGENNKEKQEETAIIMDCWDELVDLTDNGPTMMGLGGVPWSSSSSSSSMMGHEEVGLAAAETSMEEMMMWSWLSEEMEVVAPPEFMMDDGGCGGGGDFWEECEIARWAMELF